MKEKQIGDPMIAISVERSVMLKFIDRHWATFLSSMEHVKQNIGSQAYGQKDPVLEYKKKGLELFNIMIDNIRNDIVLNFMRCQVRVDNIPMNAQKNE
jgi:preprotein translocase subunit SecA